jgi:threonine dehydrogenase-like Zn-dependent dehydrogenase
VSAPSGALTEPLAAALHNLTQSDAKPGERVSIVGAGAIGLYVAFWARRLGASDAIATDLHRFQQQRAMSLGAAAFVKTDAERAGAVSGSARRIRPPSKSGCDFLVFYGWKRERRNRIVGHGARG